MADLTVTVLDNGPFLLKGDVDVVDAEGTAFPTKGQVALCRCGASDTKPFCNGAHAKAGFQSAERAPKA